ncbi:MAG: ribosome biogenesis GTPase Der [Rickettsiales bacterium]|jgi:GTP-binding protein|nr:ribosome biogenesis GTPase Der [Rickettsiales bacterium]
MLKVVIAGRPNVGKSSVFNKLTRTRDALVHDQPGITRDVVEGVGKIKTTPAFGHPCAGGELMEYRLFDTAGIENSKDLLAQAITGLARDALRNADVILFVVDGTHGIHPGDEAVAREVRKLGKPVLLLMNKADSKKAAGREHEFLKLGLGEPLAVSAEHKIGFEGIENFIKDHPAACCGTPPQEGNFSIKMAIMGQPNVGKSTLINKIVGEKRMLAYDQPGITRDSVQVPFSFDGKDLILVDTPGLRRKGKVKEDIETLAALKALALIDEVDAVVLVIDATLGVEKYDMNIAARVAEAGKVLCVALNKWDKIPAASRDELVLKLKHDFKNSFNQIVKPMMLPISAETGTGIKNMMKRVLEAVEKSKTRLPTSYINRVIEKLVKKNQPPMSRIKRPMKIKFAAQTDVAPIGITLYVGEIVDLPESYERYLRNGLSKEIGWENLVVRIHYKKGGNPYKDK